jgi:hypothetical protein
MGMLTDQSKGMQNSPLEYEMFPGSNTWLRCKIINLIEFVEERKCQF